MASVPTPFLRPQDYLELDSHAERPSEYYDGAIYPIEATTLNHSRILVKLTRFLDQALEGKPCEVMGPTVRVRLPNKRYAYPDVLVVCGKIELDSPDYQTVLNPAAVIEVLSPSTQDFDRGGKADLYRGIPTVKEYVIVAQDRLFVQRYTRQAEHRWSLDEFTGPDAVLRLESAEVDIPVREIYERVEFEPGE